MHVDLDQGLISDAAEAVDLPGLDHKDIASARLELLSVHGPEPATLSDELHFIVWVTVRSGAPAGEGTEKKHRDVYIPVVDADELVRAALKRQFLLSDAIHRKMLL